MLSQNRSNMHETKTDNCADNSGEISGSSASNVTATSSNDTSQHTDDVSPSRSDTESTSISAITLTLSAFPSESTCPLTPDTTIAAHLDTAVSDVTWLSGPQPATSTCDPEPAAVLDTAVNDVTRLAGPQSATSTCDPEPAAVLDTAVNDVTRLAGPQSATSTCDPEPAAVLDTAVNDVTRLAGPQPDTSTCDPEPAADLSTQDGFQSSDDEVSDDENKTATNVATIHIEEGLQFYDSDSDDECSDEDVVTDSDIEDKEEAKGGESRSFDSRAVSSYDGAGSHHTSLAQTATYNVFAIPEVSHSEEESSSEIYNPVNVERESSSDRNNSLPDSNVDSRSLSASNIGRHRLFDIYAASDSERDSDSSSSDTVYEGEDSDSSTCSNTSLSESDEDTYINNITYPGGRIAATSDDDSGSDTDDSSPDEGDTSSDSDDTSASSSDGEDSDSSLSGSDDSNTSLSGSDTKHPDIRESNSEGSSTDTTQRSSDRDENNYDDKYAISGTAKGNGRSQFAGSDDSAGLIKHGKRSRGSSFVNQDPVPGTSSQPDKPRGRKRYRDYYIVEIDQMPSASTGITNGHCDTEPVPGTSTGITHVRKRIRCTSPIKRKPNRRKRYRGSNRYNQKPIIREFKRESSPFNRETVSNSVGAMDNRTHDRVSIMYEEEQVPSTSTGITQNRVPSPFNREPMQTPPTGKTRSRKRRRDSSTYDKESLLKRIKLDLDGADTYYYCPMDCPCKVRVPVKTPPQIQRRFRVVEPLCKKLLKSRTLDPLYQVESQCCDRYCSFRWSIKRVDSVEVLDDYWPDDLDVYNFRWGQWKGGHGHLY